MKLSGLTCLILLTISAYINKSFGQTAALQTTLPYKNSALTADQRVNDLLLRMTIEEKIKQLDMYRGWDLVPMGQSHEATIYDEAMIAKTLGNYSVGSIHDFYPAFASLSNKVQQYVIEHSRLG